MVSATAKSSKLVRKQFLISTRHISKLSKIAKAEGKSEAEIVRLAIEAFDPAHEEDMTSSDLMELVSQRLKEAIKTTKKANTLVKKALRTLQVEN